GGRIFPGMHHRAEFTVREAAGRFDISVRSRDGQTTLAVRGCQAASLPHSSVFGSLEEASAFFEAGSVGYSATRDPSRFDGLELRCTGWRIEPLAVEEVHSSFFDDQARFPKGTTEFDCALLMRGISHEWHRRAHLCCPASQSLLTGAVARIH
ncbi:MAG TPA: hypothetical protein VML55_20945, partial [Planctomycetaceae bacterium]|nr:hypothetical protein [Planctomycetaceae bacterium]